VGFGVWVLSQSLGLGCCIKICLELQRPGWASEAPDFSRCGMLGPNLGWGLWFGLPVVAEIQLRQRRVV
jgi:hypothetical protein